MVKIYVKLVSTPRLLQAYAHNSMENAPAHGQGVVFPRRDRSLVQDIPELLDPRRVRSPVQRSGRVLYKTPYAPIVIKVMRTNMVHG